MIKEKSIFHTFIFPMFFLANTNGCVTVDSQSLSGKHIEIRPTKVDYLFNMPKLDKFKKFCPKKGCRSRVAYKLIDSNGDKIKGRIVLFTYDSIWKLDQIKGDFCSGTYVCKAEGAMNGGKGGAWGADHCSQGDKEVNPETLRYLWQSNCHAPVDLKRIGKIMAKKTDHQEMTLTMGCYAYKPTHRGIKGYLKHVCVKPGTPVEFIYSERKKFE